MRSKERNSQVESLVDELGLDSGLAIGGDGRKVTGDGGGKNETTNVKN